jgi:hypothetical protein
VRALRRDSLPNGIFYAIKISSFSAAALLAYLIAALKVCPCPQFGGSYFILLAQTFSPASKRLPSKDEIFGLNPSWSLHPFPKLLSYKRISAANK